MLDLLILSVLQKPTLYFSLFLSPVFWLVGKRFENLSFFRHFSANCSKSFDLRFSSVSMFSSRRASEYVVYFSFNMSFVKHF